MSKIGKKIIVIPSGVQVTLKEKEVSVKGPKGELHWINPSCLSISLTDNQLQVQRKGDEKEERRLHGLSRAMIQNMVQGVSKGFEKRLEMIGVGYRAQVSGKKIVLNLGFSHPIEYQPPEGVVIATDPEQKNIIIVSGIDRQKVGQVASQLRALRPPEPYKGKGIKYVNETIVRKAGKTAGAKESTS